MYKEWIKKYSGWFILGLLLIATYKLFDELIAVSNWFLTIIGILRPFLIGAALSYLLYIPANILERKFLRSEKKWLKEHARSSSVFLVFFIFVLLMIGTVMYLMPMVRNNILEIIDRLPVYNQQIESFLNHLTNEFDLPNLYVVLNERVEEVINAIFNFKGFDPLVMISHGMGIVNTLFDWLMAIVVCPYILLEREHLLKMFDSIISIKICERDVRFIHRYASKINQIFSDFIFGKALDSLIVGVIAYVAFSLMNLKFSLLLALVILVTNMIPYFGPFIGGIPVTIFTAMTMGLTPGIWTGIFIIALQQFDGLILGPYILGESVGVSPLWIIFAITFFGGIFGFVGMFIGVPLIAVIRMIFEDYVRYQHLKSLIIESGVLKN